MTSPTSTAAGFFEAAKYSCQYADYQHDGKNDDSPDYPQEKLQWRFQDCLRSLEMFALNAA